MAKKKVHFDKPLRRRLVADKALMMNGFNSATEVTEACIVQSRRDGDNLTFHWRSVSLYISGDCNFSWPRLKVLSRVLNIKNIADMDEIFTFDQQTSNWYGDQGGIATMTIRNMSGRR